MVNDKEAEEILSQVNVNRTDEEINYTENKALQKMVDIIISEDFLKRWGNEEDTARAANIQKMVKETLEKDGFYKAADVAIIELCKII